MSEVLLKRERERERERAEPWLLEREREREEPWLVVCVCVCVCVCVASNSEGQALRGSGPQQLTTIEQVTNQPCRCSGSNVIPRRARPGIAGLRPHSVGAPSRSRGAPVTHALHSSPLLTSVHTATCTGVPRSYETAPPLGPPWGPR